MAEAGLLGSKHITAKLDGSGPCTSLLTFNDFRRVGSTYLRRTLAPGLRSMSSTPNRVHTHLTLSHEALFRYAVVSEVRTRTLGGSSLSLAIADVLALPHYDLQGQLRFLSARTLQRWLTAVQDGGAGALEPKLVQRSSTAIPAKLMAFIRLEKDSDSEASLPELLKRARLLGIIAEDEPIHRSTLWRTCHRQGVALSRTRRLATADMRRFAYPHRMMMILCDGKHFRAGPARLRRVALIFIDDASRFVLDAVVGTSETCALFLSGLHSAIRRHGLMKALYLDRGPGFIADDTATVLVNLDIPLIHGRARYPEGHGKVERFNRTLLSQLLRSFPGNPEIDPDPGALRLRLLHWIQTDYNRSHHESINMSPEEAWLADETPLHFPRDDAWVDSRFVATVERTVSKDNVISFQGVAYEVPRGNAGRRITITRLLLEENALMVLHEGRFIRIHPVDLVANAYDRRGWQQRPKKSVSPTTTAASLAFKADMAPLVNEDGGFPAQEDPDDDDDPVR